MEENGLLEPERLLTGYIPGGEALSSVKDLATRLRHKNSQMIYLLDPVLGDSGKLYVAPDVIPIYRSMLPLSTIITPNWFEVEVLTDIRITDLLSLRKALRILHEEHHVPNVVVSSIPLRAWMYESLPSHIQHPLDADNPQPDDGYLLCISSSTEDPDRGGYPSTVHARSIPLIPGYFSGVGDLFSALLLAHYQPTSEYLVSESVNANGHPLPIAASEALSKTHAMLALTQEYSMSLPEDERLPTDEEIDEQEPSRKIRRMKGRELRLIQGQDIIRGTRPIEHRKMELWTGFWSS
ncbi:unnamed protein product [Somion occarium]